MSEEKPHLVLNWIFDIPNQILSCTISENLIYIAHAGGHEGYTKKYRTESNSEFVETRIEREAWDTEKFWISENYGDIYGYYQPDHDRTITHPIENRPDWCPNGLGPDGRYLDHLQRMQILLDGEDCARIGVGISHTTYETPDCGKTIYKRPAVTNVLYPDQQPNAWWTDHSQPCMMQPWAKGKQLSSYDEMFLDGIFAEAIRKCMKGEWASPPHPELQQFYIYPKEVDNPAV